MSAHSGSQRVVALMTTRDCAHTIAEVVATCLATPLVDACIVVDDGSRDETASVAQAAGARVVRLWNHVGAGKALDTALMRAEDASIIVVVEPETDELAETITALVDELAGSGCGLAFTTTTAERTTTLDRVNRGALAQAGVRLGASARLTGDWAMNQEVAAACRPLSTGFAAELICIARSSGTGREIREVAIARRRARSARLGIETSVRLAHAILGRAGLARERRVSGRIGPRL